MKILARADNSRITMAGVVIHDSDTLSHQA